MPTFQSAEVLELESGAHLMLQHCWHVCFYCHPEADHLTYKCVVLPKPKGPPGCHPALERQNAYKHTSARVVCGGFGNLETQQLPIFLKLLVAQIALPPHEKHSHRMKSMVKTLVTIRQARSACQSQACHAMCEERVALAGRYTPIGAAQTSQQCSMLYSFVFHYL